MYGHSNGHVGQEIRWMDDHEKQTQFFRVAFSYNILSEDEGEFVLHVSPTTSFLSGGLSGEDFLSRAGFEHFSGCQKFHNRCFYKVIATVNREELRASWGADQIHRQVRDFTGKLDEIFETTRDLYNNMRGLELTLPIRYQDTTPVPVDTSKPIWLPRYVSERQKSAEKEIEKQQGIIQEEGLKLALLYAYGSPLEDAVEYVFKRLGFQTEKTPKGATVDLIVQAQNQVYGLEITGTKEPIKKGSKKVSQVLTYLNEGSGKPVVVANTQKDIEPEKREAPFTDPVLALIKNMGALAITTHQLHSFLDRAEDPEFQENFRKALRNQTGSFILEDT